MAARSLWHNLERVGGQLIDPRSTGLLTDVDGTLSEIRERPEDASVSPEIVAALGELCEHYALTAVISGRRAADVARMIGRPELLYVGNHGLEIMRAGNVVEDGGSLTSIAAAKALIESRMPDAPGLNLEDKRLVLAIHYRRCRDEGAIGEARSLAAQVAAEHGLRVQEGRRVIEIRPMNADKGAAVVGLAREYGLKQVIYVGDDRTDIDAFRALKSAPAIGAGTIAIGVRGSESPEDLEREADYFVDSVSEVGQFLNWLIDLRRRA